MAYVIKTADGLRSRLRWIFEDRNFSFDSKSFHPHECLLMVRDGPQRPVDQLDQITNHQWDMIEELLTAHEQLMADGETT